MPGASDAPPRGSRRVLHVDVDAFLASVEQALHPELRGVPVIVGGLPDTRNLVMSCSYSARAFGIRPGMRSQEAARRCPQAVFRHGDSQAANRAREALARILYRYSPRVEVASIDDFFVDLSGTLHLPESLSEGLSGTGSMSVSSAAAARALAERVRREVGEELYLPVTIGIGANRTLARVAGKFAKPGGVAEVLPGYEQSFLRGLPVEHLPGVGHTTRRVLERFAIRTVGDLSLVSREVLFASFGALGLVLYERSRGIDPTPVDATFSVGADGSVELRLPRSIQRVSTFEPEEGRRGMVEAMLAYIVERAAHRLRTHGLCARSLEVRVGYVDTRPPSMRPRSLDSGASVARRQSLERAGDSTDELIQHARRLFRQLPRKRALVKRIGLTLRNLCRDTGWQHSLFSDPLDPRGGRELEHSEVPDLYATDLYGQDSCGTNRSIVPSENLRPVGLGSIGLGSIGSDPSVVSGNNDVAGRQAPHRESRADRQRHLDRVLDALRRKYGFGRILRGSSLPLTEDWPLERDGFRLRTPSLNQ